MVRSQVEVVVTNGLCFFPGGELGEMTGEEGVKESRETSSMRLASSPRAHPVS